jgi:hypothetical protein
MESKVRQEDGEQPDANPEVDLPPLMTGQTPQGQRLVGPRRQRKKKDVPGRNHPYKDCRGQEIYGQVNGGSLQVSLLELIAPTDGRGRMPPPNRRCWCIERRTTPITGRRRSIVCSSRPSSPLPCIGWFGSLRRAIAPLTSTFHDSVDDAAHAGHSQDQPQQGADIRGFNVQ